MWNLACMQIAWELETNKWRLIYHLESNRSLRKQPTCLEKMGIIQCMVWRRYCKNCKWAFFVLVLLSEKVMFLVAEAERFPSARRKKYLESKITHNRKFKGQNLLKRRHFNPYFCLLGLLIPISPPLSH